MKEDHSQFRWFLSEDLGDIWRGFPIHHLASYSSPLENEMKKRPWTTVLIIGRRSFPDGNLDRHRQFLEGRAVLVVR
jgi:hypothetical protein